LIPGPAGALESLLEWDPQGLPRLVVLLCHPHPQYGGTLHSKVVFRATKAALESGLPTLRFNFRGVGESEGKYDSGRGERDDARAALDYLQTRFSGTPMSVMGFSFGAWVGLDVGASDPRVSVLVGLGLPTDDLLLPFDFLKKVRKPILIVQGTQDEFATRGDVESIFASIEEPKRLHWVEGADHFFTGRLDEVQGTIREFLTEVVAKLPKVEP
jgi:alpha/beta superfamily hydrolase